MPAPANLEESGFWLALAQVEGLGSAGAKKLIEHFGTPQAAFAAAEAELSEVPGLDRRALRGLLGFRAWERVQRELARVREAQVTLVALNHPGYPPRLRQLPDAPPFLYVRGELRAEDERAVAVVGSRSASPYGLKIARELCRDLSALGFTIVSGLARGIDGEAHAAALAAGGRTIAVLGSGVDVIYPGEHRALADRMAGGAGAVLSELRLGTRPLAHHFPARNRIISGLALGVVVVEATERSGSLITARLAMDQGREVFAVPGQAGASRSRGTHQLIREGAKLVENVDDILEEIAPQLRPSARAASARGAPVPEDLEEEQRKIWQLIQLAPLQIDELIDASGLSPARVSEILLRLEIRGLARQLPGKRFLAS
ncbi:MAG TPA: DNA-processing protein DprA [Candidatus Acidoferrales bacterium]|nr:DNA-processing protein DprA [Candidatus Acidoferrales bacterium]